GSEDFQSELQAEYFLDPEASDQLIRLLSSQRAVTRADLPHRHHLLVERVESGPGGVPGHQIVLHTFWGNRLNRPFGLALEAALGERYGVDPEIYVHNNCVVLALPDESPAEEILSFVTTANLDGLLRRRLERSGFFGARFRESAGRALLLEKRRRFERMPLWMSRLKSQKLLNAVLEYEDFPILLEAWRTCLQDAFDLEHLHQVLAELESGSIRWSETETPRPSPFAGAVTWRQVNHYMYMDDAPKSGQSSSLSSDLIRDVALSPGLRPQIPEEIAAEFGRKRQRLSEGYSPQSPQDLLDWVKERLLIPAGEWTDLLAAMARDHELDPGEVEDALAGKITRISPDAAEEPLVIALEQEARIRTGLLGEEDASGSNDDSEDPAGSQNDDEDPAGSNDYDEDPDDVLTSILGEWLQFYPPREISTVESVLGVDASRLARALEELVEAQKAVVGDLIIEGEDRVCDRENLEILLRLKRAQAVPSFRALDIRWLPVFLAQAQGLVDPAEDFDGMAARSDRLVGYYAPAGFWESDILPARSSRYSQAWMDRLVQEGSLCWVGTEDRKVALFYEPEMDLMAAGPSVTEEGEEETPPGGEDDDLDALFPDPTARYGFTTMLSRSGKSADALAQALWDGVWEGRVTNDSFAALRRGVETRFKPPRAPFVSGGRRGRTRRRGFDQWRSSSPFAGNWYLLPQIVDAGDLLEHEERLKDRVRVLLDRYGILFRELLLREAPGFQWSDLFRSLRLMELSGEVVTGHFFEGITGPQFMSHQAFRRLQNGLPDDLIYWMNAADPASACGLTLESLRGHLPRRVTTTHMVFRGPDVVLLSRRNGKILDFSIPHDDPDMEACLVGLRHQLYREFQPLKQISVETINEANAADSPYVGCLRSSFEVRKDFKIVKLHRKMGGQERRKAL
ncbi:MAG: ATP-dependent helicase, partial [Candidatus Latescibacteria bacterium]|nr:ATP-dependent helicase [Candidatus Latescibacterota bacterium]